MITPAFQIYIKTLIKKTCEQRWPFTHALTRIPEHSSDPLLDRNLFLIFGIQGVASYIIDICNWTGFFHSIPSIFQMKTEFDSRYILPNPGSSTRIRVSLNWNTVIQIAFIMMVSKIQNFVIDRSFLSLNTIAPNYHCTMDLHNICWWWFIIRCIIRPISLIRLVIQSCPPTTKTTWSRLR